MGTGLSCVPHNNVHFSGKNFIRRNSSGLFRKKNPQEGQVKSNSIINILCTVTPRKELSAKDLETIQNIKWEPPFAYDPAAGWKKSSINVKNYGRMIHSSKVQFRFLHCQSIHDCFLDLFQTHLHFVSNTTTGLTYQGTLPLGDVTVCKVSEGSDDPRPQPFAFQISGAGLNPIIVYCSSQEEMDTWLGHLKEHVEGNGGTVITDEHRTYARVKNPECIMKGREDLRNSVKNEPIYEWEGSHRESLGAITYVTKVKLQHLPCQEQYDRLLVMYSSNIIILSEESDGLFYKGKLPLNSITVTTPCQDVRPNTFMIEGKLINPIVVSCLDENEYRSWIGHFNTMHIPVQIPPPPVYDIIYTPTKTKAPQPDQWDALNWHEQRHSQKGRGSHDVPLHGHMDDLMSPGYTTPLCHASSRPTSVESHPPLFCSRPTSTEPHPPLFCSRPTSAEPHPPLFCSRPTSAEPHPPLFCSRPTSAEPHPPLFCNRHTLMDSHPPSFCSRPSSVESHLQARMSTRSDSVSSKTRPALELQRKLSQRSTQPCCDTGTSTDVPLSPIYNTPYVPTHCSAPFRREEKAPLVKSNSWSMPQTDVKQQLSGPQRNSDMCASRKVLSPVYDDPWTPGLHVSEDNYVKPAQMSRQCRARQEGPSLLPYSFRLQTPPPGRRMTNPPHSQQEAECERGQQAGQYKLLSPPTAVLRQRGVTQAIVQPQPQMSANYSQEDISYLEPAEPDDQEVDYDNIWDFECDSGMSQALSGISAHRTLAP